MLIEVCIDDVEVGMYVHALDIPWNKHPFWRPRFAVRSSTDIEKLRHAGVRFATIDTSKGIEPKPLNPTDSTVHTQPLTVPAPPPTARVRPSRPAFSAQFEKPLTPPGGAGRLSASERKQELRKASKTLARAKTEVMRLFSDARMGQAIKPTRMKSLVEQIASSVSKDPSIMLNVARLKSKDEYTYLHSVSVCALMINFGRKLGLDEATVRELGMAGMLHDVGKISIPDEILNKPGKLDDDEFKVIRNHPERGHAILSSAKAVSQTALDVCLLHHEKMDGTGYPQKAKAGDLSLAVRMSAICDVYDAITSQRSYNRPYSGAEALQKMLSWQGHFDQLLLRTFIESLGIHPIGSYVRMNDNSLAVVIGEDSEDYTQPMVRKFYSFDTDRPLEHKDIQLRRDCPEHAILSTETGLSTDLEQLGTMALMAAARG